MIISASRRTDIPAFYSPWLLNRLRAGRVLVRNPFNFHQVSEIRLSPAVVEALILWTKNPAPLLPHLDEIEAMGYPVLIHYTITACDRYVEPGLPDVSQRLAAFRVLSDMVGPDRVLWRFDPILLTQAQGIDHCLDRFTGLAGALEGLTHQCSISFVSLYAKCRRNLTGVGLLNPDALMKKELVMELAFLAKAHGMRLKACCDEFLTDECGIDQAHCIDAAQLGGILGCNLQVRKDPGQRRGCGCSMSIDIGAYDSCAHGCRYCYANTSHQAVARNIAAHDPDSPLLIGHLQGNETIRKREMISLRVGQPSLFDSFPLKI
ncbi:MAG: DUF1848 domain-containing protein [Desulfobulbus sp.]